MMAKAAGIPAPRGGRDRQCFLVFDSGVGGLTVLREIAKARPDAQYIYVADDAAFPYGALDDQTLIQRVGDVIGHFDAMHAPDCIIVACNTASTLVLPSLRARFSVPVIGTVPAIKPAARLSANKLIAVLATPGTVKRDYTRALIAAHAPDAEVILVGAQRLAALAEQWLRGESVDEQAVRDEIMPCFVTRTMTGMRDLRTDVVALSCTHYPLLLPLFQKIAPWPVMWVDPAKAIARRVVQLMGAGGVRSRLHAASGNIAYFTGSKPVSAVMQAVFRTRGFAHAASEPLLIRL